MKQKISILSSLTMNGGSSWGRGTAITWVCGVQEDTTHQSWKFGFRPSLQGILWESRGFRQKKKAGGKKKGKSRKQKSGGNRIRVGTSWESKEKPIFPLGNRRVCYLLLLAWGMQIQRDGVDKREPTSSSELKAMCMI